MLRHGGGVGFLLTVLTVAVRSIFKECQSRSRLRLKRRKGTFNPGLKQ